jgi:hypothetical protein
MIERSGTGPMSSITELIGRIANNDIEFHRKKVRGFIGVDKLIGVCFEGLVAIVFFLTGSAILAFTVFPDMLYSLKHDVSVFVRKRITDGVFTICQLGTVDTPS